MPNKLPKKVEIDHLLLQNKAKIDSSETVVYIVDECHLLWGDICGYVWGATNERITIPITNERQRQTYYGALNYLTQEFTVKGYEQGNSENTIQFVSYLRAKHPGKQVIIIWDGASYHRSTAIKEYLQEINDNSLPEQNPLFLIQFAPNAPEQNPVEAIWLKGKTFIREHFHLTATFADVKRLFVQRINDQLFELPANCAFA